MPRGLQAARDKREVLEEILRYTGDGGGVLGGDGRHRAGVLKVKVGRSVGRAGRGHEGCLCGAGLERSPVVLAEERLCTDGLLPCLTAETKATGRGAVEEPGKQRATALGEGARKVEGFAENLLVQLLLGTIRIRVHAVEESLACQHLIRHHTERPPVHLVSVKLVANNLGSKIVWRAAEGVGFAGGVTGHVLCKTKVGNVDVPRAVKHHVVQLEVAIEDLVLVQEEETKGDLGDVEGGGILGEPALLERLEHQVAARVKVHDKKDVAGRLEGTNKVREKGTLRSLDQQRSLRRGGGQVTLLDDARLLESLDSNEHGAGAVACEQHLAKVATTKHLEVFKVGFLELLRSGRQRQRRHGRHLQVVHGRGAQ
eukprot:m.224374 g.224374  ORF g.224374 m.224374 type:complete len:370 (-) comp16456_c0_seq1:877-1986(-)